MRNEENIVEFVRDVLGCKCPDEVFEKIEHLDGDARTNIYTRSITIGGRLLIYVWGTNDPSLVEAQLPAMLVDGKNERDRRGLNRFRAVIATDAVVFFASEQAGWITGQLSFVHGGHRMALGQ